MKYILFRNRLSLSSGTGQLISMQAKFIKKSSGSCEVYCNKGKIKFAFNTGLIPKQARVINNILNINNNAHRTIIIDHDSSLFNANFNFIHNIPDINNNKSWHYLQWLSSSKCHTIVNSNFTKKSIVKLSIPSEKISVVYPGFNDQKFNLSVKLDFKEKYRKKLGIHRGECIVGFITSGDFDKRGLDKFLDICSKISQVKSNVHFLVLGSKSIPNTLLNHPIVQSPLFHHVPKNSVPERWLSTIDIFVYPAKFEEFGMVIPEALALGIPVITTRNVGASEILPKEYSDYIHDNVDIKWFANRVIRLLNNEKEYYRLVAANEEALDYNHLSYSRRTMKIISGT